MTDSVRGATTCLIRTSRAANIASQHNGSCDMIGFGAFRWEFPDAALRGELTYLIGHLCIRSKLAICLMECQWGICVIELGERWSYGCVWFVWYQSGLEHQEAQAQLEWLSESASSLKWTKVVVFTCQESECEYLNPPDQTPWFNCGQYIILHLYCASRSRFNCFEYERLTAAMDSWVLSLASIKRVCFTTSIMKTISVSFA